MFSLTPRRGHCRQQRAWQLEHEGQAGRLQLARKQEALMREQNELGASQLRQQRAVAAALETEVRNIEGLNAQLEARCASFLQERHKPLVPEQRP